MNGFFSMDGTLYKIFSLIADLVILSLAWLVLSIPSLFICSGAATTALFYVLTKRISNREGRLLQGFWRSFRGNFRQATLCWLVLLAIFALTALDFIFADLTGNLKTVLLPIQVLVALEAAITSVYVFPLIARFELGFTQVFKTAFILANRHIFTSLLCVLLFAAVLLLSYLTILFSFAAAGAYAYAASKLLMGIFKKYRPELDSDG